MSGNTYNVRSWEEGVSIEHVPKDNVIFERHGNSTAELPLKELLELHRAIGYILHVSGAGEDIDLLIRQLEGDVEEGSAMLLGDLVSLQMGRSKLRWDWDLPD